MATDQQRAVIAFLQLYDATPYEITMLANQQARRMAPGAAHGHMRSSLHLTCQAF
jgi:hypothetical protein